VSAGKLQADPHTGHVFQQVQIKNTGNTPVPASMFLVLDNLSTNATVVNSGGLKTAMLAPLGSPYVSVNLTGPDHGVGNNADNNFLQPNGTVTLTLEFLSTGGAITYDARVLTVTATP
jgi:hypothetical protein